MAEQKCAACGATYHKDGGFYKCNTCGDIYCHDCANHQTKQEKQISESVKSGDRDGYVRAVCPSCKSEMFVF